MTNSLPDATQFAKKFFDKPEGKVGMVVLSMIIVGALITLYYLLPFIIILLQNTLHAIALFAGVAAVIYLASDPKVRALVSYGYQSIMRAITGAFITIDPIGITKNYIAQLRKGIRDMDKHMGRVKGQIKSLEMAISENSKSIVNSLKIAKSAEKHDQSLVMRASARKAKRRQDNNIEYKDMLAKMQHLYEIIKKIREVTEFMVDDMDDDLNMRIKKYNVMRMAHSAFKSAMSVIQGKPNERAMFERALEHMEMDVANKAGEMERFIEMSANVIASVDIQNGIYEEEGMILLEEFEEKGLAMLLGELEQMPSGKTLSESPIDISKIKIDPGTGKGKYF